MALIIRRRSRKRSGKLPKWLWLFFGALILVSAVGGAGVGILVGYEYNIPNVQSLEDFQPDVITDVYSDDNQVIGELYLERRIIVPFEEIPQNLQLAILATEDKHFYSHTGINYLSIIRAVTKDLIKRSFPVGKGASTITQQLSRMLLLSNTKTYDRKIKEILIAWKIEKIYTKQQILTLYCNLHPMGHGIYGVAAAADSYFGKQVKDLTLEECALIAGLPSNPTRYSPRLHPAAAVTRRNFVLDRMATEGMITPELANDAKKRPLVPIEQNAGVMETTSHFVERVRQHLAERHSTDEIWREGLRVHTTLNVEMQKAAYNALRNGIERIDKKSGWRGPIVNISETSARNMRNIDAYSHSSWQYPLVQGNVIAGLVVDMDGDQATIKLGGYQGRIGPEQIQWTLATSPGEILKPGDVAWFRIHSWNDTDHTISLSLDQAPKVDGAMIVLENSTGKIKAMVGGYDFRVSEFNRATQAMRQIGSTIKPLVYATAFEKGITQDSTIEDTPFHYTDDLGRSWQPENYDREFKGEVTVRQALTESRNVPTIKIAELIGIENVVVMARRFRLSGSIKPYLSLAIGACEATPLEMASAYTVFPNLGIQPTPYFINRIEDYNGQLKEKHTPKTHRVLEPEIAEEILDLLQNVIQNGTAKAAASINRPLGGKTGTTNDFTDAWFVGFTPSITAAVWIGHDRNETLGDRQSGGVVALPIWIEFMKEILKDQPVEQFKTARSDEHTASDSEAEEP